MLSGRIASPEMVSEANPPEGFEPILSHSQFAFDNGPIFEKRSADGGWVRGFRVLERHTNAGGMCHGGMLMTFADVVLSTAVMDVAPPPFVTVRLTTDFIGPAPMGAWITGSAKVTGVNESLVLLSGEILADDKQAASLSGAFKLLGKRA